MKIYFKNFTMKRSVLYRKILDGDSEREQLVLPEKYRKEKLNGLHTDVGHPGRNRTLRLLRERYFWPGIFSDTEEYISKCERCIWRKK
jgi:hypothetical protein